MTIIVAVTRNDRTVMAADTLTLYGDSQRVPALNSTTTKVRRIGESLVGSAGWAVYDNILMDYLGDLPMPRLGDEQEIFTFFLGFWRALHDRYPFVNDQAQGKDSPFGDLDSTFLIANANGIFKVSHDMDICRFRQYFAIGSGTDYALGCLYSLYDEHSDIEELARKAVETATRFDTQCGGQTVVMSLDGGR